MIALKYLFIERKLCVSLNRRKESDFHSLYCSVVETKLKMLDPIFVKPFPFNVVLFTPYKSTPSPLVQ